ncbi:nuclear transport factor 2 family protein [Bradyrhizobium macuxiense]|uniref:nuclear transport factor 2 family protein n=1 Tax=Bradyrhizobium macuxiense TaxID=1755647 RepID=UPI0009E96B07|nr:nuclear transport factor 2 family protein [Bradyrhizobium macuxiense]
MRGSLIFVALLTVHLAIPAAAQQPSEQQARPAIERLLETWDAAANRKDAAAVAALYTEDATRVTPRGISYGRPAIEKDLAESFKVTSNIVDKVEKVEMVGEVVLVTATWSATLQSKDGPIQARGLWGGVYVRDGDAWKTRLAIINRALQPPPQQAAKQ